MRLLEGGEIAVRAEHDDGDAAQLGVGAHEPQELEPVEGGEVKVEDDGGRRSLAEHFERPRVAEIDCDGVRTGEVARELVAQIGVVVDDRQGVLGSTRHSDLPRGRKTSLAHSGAGAR
jgi:hypothetical protein